MIQGKLNQMTKDAGDEAMFSSIIPLWNEIVITAWSSILCGESSTWAQI